MFQSPVENVAMAQEEWSQFQWKCLGHSRGLEEDWGINLLYTNHLRCAETAMNS
ncbi:UNVERIFIED_CONTAM: hypothetical protein FKN15_032809 [Acipenser sinensis]